MLLPQVLGYDQSKQFVVSQISRLSCIELASILRAGLGRHSYLSSRGRRAERGLLGNSPANRADLDRGQRQPLERYLARSTKDRERGFRFFSWAKISGWAPTTIEELTGHVSMDFHIYCFWISIVLLPRTWWKNFTKRLPG